MSRNRAEPQSRIFDQLVLNGTLEYLVAMSHIHIKHFVFCVGPNYRQISTREDILKSNGIIGRIQGDQDSNAFIQARARFPDIPLIVRRLETAWKVYCYRMGRIIDGELRRQWRPAVDVKYAATEEIHKPRPV